MANPEHIEIVRLGPGAIAAWRIAHPAEQLDLIGADLTGSQLPQAALSSADFRLANLRDVNFGEADLSAARLAYSNLSGANLSAATLFDADLTWVDAIGANFRAANLGNASLIGANLSGAYLGGANLKGAQLSRATLNWTELTGADISEVTLAMTALCGLDLSAVKGLPSARHRFLSSVGVDTLITSFRRARSVITPELATFFRATGVPQELLDALPCIVAEIKYYSCFISYGQPDLTFATKLYENLKSRGVSCWLYEMDKTVGKPTRREIAEVRRGADRFVVLCSAAALVRDGVLEEIEDQINEDPERLVPISLDDLWREPGFQVMRGKHNLKPELENRNYADFANRPYEEALEELLRGLRRPEAKKTRRKKG
jgi:hypothetical protein